mmetsp:Transcript_24428/g.56275  ORF Transcript_24428/g.56275 Transcript_24428/m.56275 type:complete len:367 (-) Transcript_24428:116-1216(-)
MLGALLGARPASGEPIAAAAPGAPLGVIWVSVDPRKGEMKIYRKAISLQVEIARQEGRLSATLHDGGYLEGATMEHILGDDPEAVQKTPAGGKRDVRRMVILEGQRYMSLHLIKDENGRWRISPCKVDGMTTERQLPVMPDDVVILGAGGMPDKSRSMPRRGGGTRAIAEERIAAGRLGKEQGLAPLWEWCHLVDMKQAHAAPPDYWGLYSEAQNEEIDRAFCAGEECATVSIGIRSYAIVFFDTTTAQQVDEALHKARPVRRRLVTPAEQQETFAASAAAMGRMAEEAGEAFECEECPLCCESFKDTKMQPVAKLRDCGHVFHRACVQEIADKQGLCPTCRGTVHWQETMAAPTAPLKPELYMGL